MERCLMEKINSIQGQRKKMYKRAWETNIEKGEKCLLKIFANIYYFYWFSLGLSRDE